VSARPARVALRRSGVIEGVLLPAWGSERGRSTSVTQVVGILLVVLAGAAAQREGRRATVTCDPAGTELGAVT
jgi:hypothetical protein